MKRKRRIACDTLEIGYLILPYILFFISWFKCFVALPISFLIIRCIIKMERLHKQQPIPQWTRIDLVTILGLIAWIYLSGIGGFVFENGDWQKHNAMISDLVNQSWPVVYKDGNKTYLLIYYLAFYLPATCVGKLFHHSVHIANFSLFLWASLGMLFLYKEIKTVFKKKAWIASICFVFFSGMDILGYFIAEPQFVEKLVSCPHIESWTYLKNQSMLQYSSHTTQLFWVPQHAIAGWIATMMIYRYQNKVSQIILIWGLTIFFSPFIFVGLFPFVIYLIVRNKIKDNLNAYFCIETLTGLLISLICGLYYVSNTNETVSMTFSFLWENVDNRQLIYSYLLFGLIEFMGLATIVLCSQKKHANDKINSRWYIISMGILLGLPLMKYGLYNDLCMRASIPALVIFWLITAQVFLDNLSYNKIRISIGIILLIGAATPMSEIGRSVLCGDNQKDSQYKTVLDMPRVYQEQYIDYHADDNWFYTKLMKRKSGIRKN